MVIYEMRPEDFDPEKILRLMKKEKKKVSNQVPSLKTVRSCDALPPTASYIGFVPEKNRP